MQLINLETKQVITQSEFKGLFPNTSLPSNINYLDYGYAVVFPAPQPEHNQVTEYCKEIAPILTSKGTWEQQWEVLKKYSTPEEEAAAIQENLNTIRDTKWQQIKQERDKRTSKGGYKVNTKWFHSDLISRSQQIALALGGFIPAGLMWKTMDGTFVEMNSTLAQQVFQAAVQSDNNIFGHAEVLKSQVMASNDPSSIDIYSGWPIAFWEE